MSILTIPEPSDNAVQLFFDLLGVHKAILGANQADLEARLTPLVQDLRALLSKVTRVLVESLTSSGPQLSVLASYKMLETMLRCLVVCEIQCGALEIYLEVVQLFELLRQQEQNYFNILREREEVIKLCLVLVAGELGVGPRGYHHHCCTYSLDITEEVAKELKEKSAAIGQEADYDLLQAKQFQVQYGEPPQKPTVVKHPASAYRLIMHTMFNFSRMYYLSDQRIIQLQLGLLIFNRLTELALDEKPPGVLCDELEEKMDTAQLIFLSALLHARDHSIFKGYMVCQQVADSVFQELGLSAFRAVTNLFRLNGHRNARMNAKLFNANFCANLSRFLREMFQAAPLKEIDSTLMAEFKWDSAAGAELQFPKVTEFLNVFPEQKEGFNWADTKVQDGLEQFLDAFKKAAPVLHEVLEKCKQIPRWLDEIYDYEYSFKVTPQLEQFSQQTRFIQNNALVPTQPYILIEQTQTEFCRGSFLRTETEAHEPRRYGKRDFSLNPFEDLDKQLQDAFCANVTADLDTVEPPAQVYVGKTASEIAGQRVKLLLSLLDIFQRLQRECSEARFLRVYEAAVLRDFAAQNSQAENLFAEHCIFQLMCGPRLLLCQPSWNGERLSIELCKDALLQLAKVPKNALRTLTAYTLKLLENTLNHCALHLLALQILVYVLYAPDCKAACEGYQKITEKELMTSHQLMYDLLQNQVLCRVAASEAVTRKNIIRALVAILDAQQVQDVHENLLMHLASLEELRPVVTQIMKQHIEYQLGNSIARQAFESLGRIIQQTAHSDFGQEGNLKTQQFFCSHFFVSVLTAVFASQAPGTRLFGQMVACQAELTPILLQLQNICRSVISRQDKNRQQKETYLNAILMPSVFRLVGTLSQYKDHVISEFFHPLLEQQITISSETVTQVLFMMQMRRFIQIEPVIFVFRNLLGEKYEVLLGFLLEVKLYLRQSLDAVQDTNFPQLCQAALLYVERLHQERYSRDQKLEATRLLLEIASMADSFNVNQILFVLKMIQRPDLDVPFTRDFLDILHENMYQNQNVPASQFVFNKNSAIQYPIQDSFSSNITHILCFKPRLASGVKDTMCLFSTVDLVSGCGFAVLLDTDAKESQANFVIQLVGRDREDSYSTKLNVWPIIQSKVDLCLHIDIEAEQTRFVISAYGTALEEQFTLKQNLAKLLFFSSEKPQPQLTIAQNVPILRSQRLRNQNSFAGSVELFYQFDERLSPQDLQQCVDPTESFQSLKQNRVLKKCRVYFSPQYLQKQHVINIAQDFRPNAVMFCSLQQASEVPALRVPQAMVARMLPGVEVRSSAPLTYQLKFVYGPNLFLCILDSLRIQEQLDHSGQTLQSLVRLINLILKMQDTEDFPLDAEALVSLLLEVPKKHFCWGFAEEFLGLVERTGLHQTQKATLLRFLAKMDFWHGTEILQEVIAVLQKRVISQSSQIDRLLKKQIACPDSLVDDVVLTLNAVGFQFIEYVQTFDDSLSTKVLELQEQIFQNAMVCLLLQDSTSDAFSVLVDQMQHRLGLPRQLNDLVIVLIQRMLYAEREVVSLSLLRTYMMAHALGLILPSHLAAVLQQEHAENLQILDILITKLRQAEALQQPLLLMRSLQAVFICTHQLSFYIGDHVLPSLPTVSECIQSFYSGSVKYQAEAISRVGFNQNIHNQLCILGEHADFVKAQALKCVLEYDPLQLSTDGINHFLFPGERRESRALVNVLPILWHKNASQLLLKSFEGMKENVLSLSTCDTFFDAILELEPDLQQFHLEYMLNTIFNKGYRLQLSVLISNLSKFNDQLQQKMRFLISSRSSTLQIEQEDDFNSLAFVCTIISGQEHGKVENLKLLVSTFVEQYYRQNRTRRGDDYWQFIIENKEMRRILLIVDCRIVTLNAYLASMLFNEPLQYEKVAEARNFTHSNHTLSEINARFEKINRMVQEQTMQVFEGRQLHAKVFVHQILQRAAILQQESCTILSDVEAESRVRNKVIAVQEPEKTVCSRFVFKMEPVSYVTVQRRLDAGALCFSFDEQGEFVLFFVHPTTTVRIMKLRAVVHTRYLFEWRGLELRTRRNQMYFFLFQKYEDVLQAIQKLKLFAHTTYRFKQQQVQIQDSQIDIPEITLQFESQARPEEEKMVAADKKKKGKQTATAENSKEIFYREIQAAHPAPQVLNNPIATLSATTLWQRRILTNYDYLMILNTFAGRTFADLAHYPIVPWVLKDYSSEYVDVEDASIYRDFALPIGAQGMENKTMQIQEKYQQSKEFVQQFQTQIPQQRLMSYSEIYNIPKAQLKCAPYSSSGFDPLVQDPFGHVQAYHHACLYQTPAFVCHFLIRLQPFTQKAIEIDRRVDTKRGFTSIPQAFQNIWSNSQDNRELIPEFFTLPQMFLDVQNIGIGDVELPPWAQSPAQFIRLHRAALESDYCSEHLHQWIDLIFGFRQQGIPAAEKLNVFGQSVFYESQVQKLNPQNPQDAQDLKAAQNMAANFGHAPAILFSEPHPARQKPKQKLARQSFAELQLGTEELLNIFVDEELGFLVETNRWFYKVQFTRSKTNCVDIHPVEPLIQEPLFAARWVDAVIQADPEAGDIPLDLQDSVIQISPTMQKKIKNEYNYLLAAGKSFRRNTKVFDNGAVHSGNLLDNSLQIQQLDTQSTSYVRQFSQITAVDSSLDYLVFGCLDGSVSLWDEDGLQPLCNQHSAIVSVSISRQTDRVCVASQSLVQIYSLSHQFIIAQEIADIRYLKLHKGYLYVFTSKYIQLYDEQNLEHIRTVRLQIDAADICFGQEVLLVVGQQRMFRYKIETLELLAKEAFPFDPTCVALCAAEQIIVIGSTEGRICVLPNIC